MKVVIEFRRNVDECTEMEIDVTEQEVDDYFKEAGDDWVLRQPLQQRLDVFARDNQEALIKANPINRDQITVEFEKRWHVERVTRSEEE
tara:strand:- start:59 stop:325 length:267 start_codon:yes stop_codon:yes gene_type:complete